jgi:uncharacterized protein YqeY
MTMRDRISDDLKSAMKSGDRIRLETLRTLRAALMEKEIERRGGAAMTAEDELGVIMSAAKKRRESIDLFTKGGRMDLAETEQKELAVIQEYLPRQMGVGEIAEVIRGVITETGAAGAADFGKVMPLVMKQLKGKADGRMVQDLVKSALGGA